MVGGSPLTSDNNLTLVIDTSSKSAAAGLYRGAEAVSESFLLAGLTHSQTLGPILERLLSLARVRADEIARVAVTNGPGSFTGLRIGVAAALGYAMASGADAVGVSTLEALAQNAAVYGAVASPDSPNRVCAVMDARRDQVYTATFRVTSGGTLERLCEDHAAAATEVIEKNAQERVIYVGDGAEICYNKEKDILPAEWRHVRAAGIIRCVLAGHTRPAERLCYLRLPQAERERLERMSTHERNSIGASADPT